MNIENLIHDFVNLNKRRRSVPYHKICATLLTGSKPYSLNSQPGYWESEYLSTKPLSIIVNCSGGRVRLLLDHVIRSAYTLEELAAN